MAYNTFTPIVSNGIVLYLDSFNLKSYSGISISTQSSVAGSSYSGDVTYPATFALNRVVDSVLYPQVISISGGDYTSIWNSYILSNGGSMDVYLSGGTPEVYNVGKTYYDTWSNNTVLYPNTTGNYVTMSYTCSMYLTQYPPYTNVIKVGGINLEGVFNAYGLIIPYTTTLQFNLTGGTSSVGPTWSCASFSKYTLNRVSDNTQQPFVVGITVTPPSQVEYYQWLQYILDGNGTIVAHLSGGATPETYTFSHVLTDYPDLPYDLILYPNFTGNFVTMSHTCSMGNWYMGSDNFVKLSGLNRIQIFQLYYQQATVALTFSLTGGVTPSTYVADNVYYDGVDTYLYNNTMIGDSYSDHTQFEVLVPEMLGTQYTDHTTMTFSYGYSPESIIFDNVSYDGVDTYILPSGVGATFGSTYSSHTNFQVVVPEIIGTQYVDNTTLTFSYFYGATAINDMTSNNATGELYNGVIFDGRDLIFDGIDDYIESFDSPIPNGYTKYTLSSWINNLNDTGGIVNYYDSAGDLGFELELYNGDIYIALSSSVYGVYTYGVVGSWVHLVVVFDGTGGTDIDKLKLYINGVEITLAYSSTIPTSISINPGTTLKIGRVDPITPNPTRYIHAKISNVISYNIALTPSQVLQNYNAQKNRFI